uniref:ANK_REP_REGION domain-containing protein n=1 Tax=Rhodnius prolixus TaxID=13249 RepID=T1HC34_RHOPR
MPGRENEGRRHSSNTTQSGHQTRNRLTRKRERLNTELLNAIISSNLRAVNKLLDEGACPWARCRTTKSSSVHLAALIGQTDILTELVRAGADLGVRDDNGVQAAHLAVWAGHIHILRIIFDIQPQLINSPIMPPEIESFQDELDSWDHDHQSIVQMMPVFELGSTALHIACKLNKVEVVEYLLSEGADVHMRDCQGLTPLDVAGTCVSDQQLINDLSTILGKSNNSADHSTDEPDVSITVDVPAEGVDQNCTDKTITRRPSKSMFDVVNALFEGGARMQDDNDIFFLGRHAWNLSITALHTAVTNGDIDLIDYLLSKGASLLTRDEHGETPLHLAVRLTLLEPLKVVISWLTLDLIDMKDGNGMTPLHQAVVQEWPSGIGLLLEAGADVTIPTRENETVLHIAAKKGNDLLLEELLSLEDSLQVINTIDIWDFTPLFRAIESNSPICVKMLIKQGADMSIKLPGNKSLLHLAADVMSLQTLEIITEHESIVNEDIDLLCDGDDGKMSPLHITAQNGSVDCTKLLIKTGANIFLRMTDIYGSTAAHLAACEGHYEVLTALISHNSACLDVPDLQGWYPLHVAARYGHGQCVVLMLRHGANISENIPDNAVTKSALDLIVEYVPKGINRLENLLDSYIDLDSCAVKDPTCLITLNYTLLLGKNEQSNDDKQLAFFDTLLNSNNVQLKETLLLHPLTESFLYFKWRSMKNFFIILISLYVLYTLSLTSFAMNTYVSYVPGFSVAFRIISIILLVPIIISECLQASTLQRYYFIDDESWLRWTMAISGGLVCLSHTNTIISRYLASLAVFLSWTELLFLFARFPAWGLHVLMFEKVASHVFQVLSRFVFLILGFLFAFMIYFRGAPPFNNFLEALCKVFIMIIELDYSGAFNDTEEVPLTYQSMLYSLFGRLMYVTFVVLVAMVMMNLIVGLCVSDVALLEVQGRTQRLAKQAAFLSFLEMSVYNKSLLLWLPTLLQEIVKDFRAVPVSFTVFPNDPLCPLPTRLKRALLKRVKASKPTKQIAATVDLKLQRIDSNVSLLAQDMNELKLSIKNINSVLTSLIQHKNDLEVVK